MVENTKHALSIQALQKSYGQIEVLKDINVTMDPHEFLVLVGPSGCGKSTLLNCIAGLEETTAGTLMIGGREVTALPPRERDIAMVFQSYALYPTMTVGENIAFGMKIRKQDKASIAAKVDEVAKLLQIESLLDRRPGQLSGGQRQRVAMGRALVRDPELFLFDEPLSNLDAKLRVEMRAEIKRLHETTGASIVYVTHDQIEAMTLATKIVVLKDGFVQQVGTPAEIYHSPANTFVADFMGSPPMNLVPATVIGKNSIRFGDGQELTGVTIPETATGEITLGIRPENFAIGSDIEVEVSSSENTGSDTYLSFEIAETKLTARLPWSFAQTGIVGLSVDKAQLRYFDRQSGQAL
ncbi:ABC transporter ATP-binding protein [Halocynthiibacter sp. C4]|uniref:ABC transporter ATP-binding protein n=1 Tax=Halocynthiibacter sp. C4 TaxID=2992758 RepID=UPI00237B657B|nr:ABC transporter ATP-binding protein [Halocynthiibacter sp. C4]MDE0588342.1 ABC transporter ATP-binding protein [Halocynthiibacter sp. C4]